jgi:AcrR family transcriptional regulator
VGTESSAEQDRVDATDGAEPVARTPLRAAHAADTRRRILEAVNQLLAEEHPAAISIPSVARLSNISPATIYRYFANKEALLDAAAASVDSSTRTWLSDDAVVPGQNLGEFLTRMWSELAENLPTLRASQFTPLGRELRSRRSERRHQDAIRGLTAAGVDVTTDAGQRLVRVVLVLTSSTIFLEQIDRLGLSPPEGAADVVWAIEALTAASIPGGTLSPGGTPMAAMPKTGTTKKPSPAAKKPASSNQKPASSKREPRGRTVD